MGRKINQKCLSCSKITRDEFQANYPECYDFRNCRHKRSYYRDLENNRLKQHRWHTWLKFKGTECFVCGGKENLECHHIEARTGKASDKRCNIVTLCEKCHNTITVFETKLGYGKNRNPRWMLAQEKYPGYAPKFEPDFDAEEYKKMVLGNPIETLPPV